MNVLTDGKTPEANALKDGRYPIMLDRERYILFSLNVMQELQEKMGSITALDELITDEKNSAKNLKWLLALLLNEGAADEETPLTERQVGRMIHPGNMQYLVNAILKAYGVGTAGSANSLVEPVGNDDSGDKDNEKNAKSGQSE